MHVLHRLSTFHFIQYFLAVFSNIINSTYHSQHRPKSNRISRLFRCDFPAMRLHGGFDDGQDDSGSLQRARVRFIRAIEPLEQPGNIYMLRCVHCMGDSNLNFSTGCAVRLISPPSGEYSNALSNSSDTLCWIAVRSFKSSVISCVYRLPFA